MNGYCYFLWAFGWLLLLLEASRLLLGWLLLFLGAVGHNGNNGNVHAKKANLEHNT